MSRLRPLTQISKTVIFDTLMNLYSRDLSKLKNEIELYTDEKVLLAVKGSIKNFGGNLCLHILENLKTNIGKGLIQIGYEGKSNFEASEEFVNRNHIYK